MFKKPMVYLLIFANTVSAGPRSPRIRFVSWELQGFRDERREREGERRSKNTSNSVHFLFATTMYLYFSTSIVKHSLCLKFLHIARISDWLVYGIM